MRNTSLVITENDVILYCACRKGSLIKYNMFHGILLNRNSFTGSFDTMKVSYEKSNAKQI